MSRRYRSSHSAWSIERNGPSGLKKTFNYHVDWQERWKIKLFKENYGSDFSIFEAALRTEAGLKDVQGPEGPFLCKAQAECEERSDETCRAG